MMPKTCKLFPRRLSFKVPCNWIRPEKLAFVHFFFFFFASFSSVTFTFYLRNATLLKGEATPISEWFTWEIHEFRTVEPVARDGTSRLTTSVAHQLVLMASCTKAAI